MSLTVQLLSVHFQWSIHCINFNAKYLIHSESWNNLQWYNWGCYVLLQKKKNRLFPTWIRALKMSPIFRGEKGSLKGPKCFLFNLISRRETDENRIIKWSIRTGESTCCPPSSINCSSSIPPKDLFINPSQLTPPLKGAFLLLKRLQMTEQLNNWM